MTYGLSQGCQCRPLSCAPCLLEWAAWEREHEAELEPYWETDMRTGERHLFMEDEAGAALARSWPKVAPAATMATVAVHGTVAICYRHLTQEAG